MEPIKKLSSSYCPNCAGVKLASKDSRAHFAFGFPTTKRRKVCPSCDYRVTTIELPLHLAEEIFQEVQKGMSMIIKRWKFKGFNHITFTNDFPDWIKMNSGKRLGHKSLWVYTQSGEVPIESGKWISINLRGHIEVHDKKPQLLFNVGLTKEIFSGFLLVATLLIIVVGLMVL